MTKLHDILKLVQNRQNVSSLMNPVNGCWDIQAILSYVLDLSAQMYRYQEIQYATNENKKYLQMPYLGADKSLARHTSRCILYAGENISFDTSFVTYINSTNIPPIMTINWIYEHQNLLSL
jgi:hypothetical protein